MARPIASEQRDASTARVPAVPRGSAIVYARYGEEKTVVMNPDDFHRLVALDESLAEIASEAPVMSDLVLEAHALEDTPGSPVEDPAAIKALLGL